MECERKNNYRKNETVIWKKSFCVEVRVEELEGLLRPEDVDVDFTRILKEARDERGRKIFETFSSNDLSFLVAGWSRWDKYKRAPWRQDSSASAIDGWRREDQEQLRVSWSPIEKKVMDAVEDYLESCSLITVDIEVVERLLRPENLEVSLWYVLKHATREAATSSSSATHRKGQTTSWQAEDDGWKVREETLQGKRTCKTSGVTLSIKEPGQRLRRAPTAPCRRPCLSKARRQLEKKKTTGS